ncbi:MAG: hypothetical protein LBC19_09285 [Tannerella sp.]|jgi:hypothetical protein|nr:hypothetical protein [Tannerella sp.]
MKQHNQHSKIRLKPLSPVEQLFADKRNIEAQCRKKEKKLGDDFACLRDNAAGVFLSVVSSLLLPPGKSGKKTGAATTGSYKRNGLKIPAAAAAPAYYAVIRSLIPTAWNIIRPMLITWGINKAKSLIYELFAGNKKKSARN